MSIVLQYNGSKPSLKMNDIYFRLSFQKKTTISQDMVVFIFDNLLYSIAFI